MNKSPMSPIGRLLVADRLHLNETRVAQAARFGITEGALRHFEAGRRVPDAAVCSRMVRAGVKVDPLMRACAKVAAIKAAEVATRKAERIARTTKNKPRARTMRTLGKIGRLCIKMAKG